MVLGSFFVEKRTRRCWVSSSSFRVPLFVSCMERMGRDLRSVMLIGTDPMDSQSLFCLSEPSVSIALAKSLFCEDTVPHDEISKRITTIVTRIIDASSRLCVCALKPTD